MAEMTLTASLRRFGRLYRPFRWQVAVFVVFTIVRVLMSVPVPFIIRTIFDSTLPEEHIGDLVAFAALLIALQAAGAALGLLSSNWMYYVNSRIVRQLRESLLDKLHSLSIRFHDSRSIGSSQELVVRETERVHTMASSGFAVIVPAGIFVLGILAVLAVLSWELLLLAIGFVPLLLAANHATTRLLRTAVLDFRTSSEALGNATLFALRTIRQTRILGAEQQARERIVPPLAAAAEADRRHSFVRMLHSELNQIVVLIWMLAVLVAGGVGVADGRLTVGQLLSFYAGIALMRGPLNQIAMALPAIITGRQALAEIDALLAKTEPNPYPGTRRVEIRGELVLDSVSFGYQDDGAVLRSASLCVRPGEVIALIGANGAGKTTIANLMLGFYAPESGRLTIDGVPYEELDMRHLRRQFGVLSQEPMLIPGTVRDNVSYGRPDLSDSDIQDALRRVSERVLTDALDNGLDSIAFENGPLLSGGQLQRIALARALLGRPRVLILDEPSNNLDAEGVETLLETLRNFSDAPAIVLITHEPQVAALADRVYRLVDGRTVPT